MLQVRPSHSPAVPLCSIQCHTVPTVHSTASHSHLPRHMSGFGEPRPETQTKTQIPTQTVIMSSADRMRTLPETLTPNPNPNLGALMLIDLGWGRVFHTWWMVDGGCRMSVVTVESHQHFLLTFAVIVICVFSKEA